MDHEQPQQAMTIGSRPPVYAVAVLSAATLAYEILLTRLFSMIHWHHFAYMIISLALLGFGASGTFVMIFRDWLMRRFTGVFMVFAGLFGVSAMGCFLVAQYVPFNTLEVLWDWRQWLWLVLIYLLLCIPFFCAATCIVLTLVAFKEQLHRVYGFDLVGAGLGALGMIILLFVFSPLEALKLIGIMGLLAAMIAAQECQLTRRRIVVTVLFLCMMMTFLLPASWSELQVSPYKGLSQVLRVTGSRIIEQRHSPLGWLAVVESPVVPLRHAPGLSLHSSAEPPPQLGVYTDGDGLSAINRYLGQDHPVRYLRDLTSALPYHLVNGDEVLILGAGGGAGILQAIDAGASYVDAVELNPQVSDLLTRTHADFAGWALIKDRVNIITKEARGYVEASDREYDLIQLSLLDSFTAASAGLYALTENYVYTVEALQTYLQRLKRGGMLAITRWVKLPPRDTLKLVATAITALEDRGIEQPGRQLVLIRSWNTSTLVVKNGAFDQDQIDALKVFCEQRGFDLGYYPGMTSVEANRFNILKQPWFFTGVKALLGDNRDAFQANYKFNIMPATDDRPHFFQFFKWSSLPEFISLRKQGGLSLLEWGYPVLVITLLQALVVGLVLIVLPLKFLLKFLGSGYGKSATSRTQLWRVAGYYLAIGLAFIFIEIVFIQKFILFLSHPVYAIAVVLSGFLLFAGLGSHLSRIVYKADNTVISRQIIAIVVSGIALLALGYMFLLPAMFKVLVSLPELLKICVSILLIAPLALLMGMPFPLALQRVGITAPELIPWAWAINGCASVVSAILATLLAIHFGFSVIILLAIGLYGCAILVQPAIPSPG